MSKKGIIDLCFTNEGAEVLDYEINSIIEVCGDGTADFIDEVLSFLNEKLPNGDFHCIVIVDIEFSKCGNPLDGEDWDAEADFEILDYEQLKE